MDISTVPQTFTLVLTREELQNVITTIEYLQSDKNKGWGWLRKKAAMDVHSVLVEALNI